MMWHFPLQKLSFPFYELANSCTFILHTCLRLQKFHSQISDKDLCWLKILPFVKHWNDQVWKSAWRKFHALVTLSYIRQVYKRIDQRWVRNPIPWNPNLFKFRIVVEKRKALTIKVFKHPIKLSMGRSALINKVIPERKWNYLSSWKSS